MITEKEMTIVRAALQYFCDEFEPHGDSFESYLRQHDRRLGIGNSDLRRVLELFRATEPRQVMLDTESNRLVSKAHFASQDVLKVPTPAKRIKYATILLPVAPEG